MFDVGFLEISVIFVVALIVVGPEKLPGLARTVGKYVGKARRYADFVRREIESEVRNAELKELAEKPAILDEVKDALTETSDALKDTEQELKEDVTADGKDSSTADPVSEDAAEKPVSKHAAEKPVQTLGDMARASWSGPTTSAPKNDDPVEAPTEESPDSTPELTDSDERRERTT